MDVYNEIAHTYAAHAKLRQVHISPRCAAFSGSITGGKPCLLLVFSGKARIRVQLSAAHTAEDINRAVDAFIAVGKELKVIQ